MTVNILSSTVVCVSPNILSMLHLQMCAEGLLIVMSISTKVFCMIGSHCIQSAVSHHMLIDPKDIEQVYVTICYLLFNK